MDCRVCSVKCEMWWSLKTSISCETSSTFDTLTHWKTKRLCSFPYRQGEARDSRLDMLELQKKHFVREFLQFSQVVSQKSTLSYEFSEEAENLPHQAHVSCEASARFHSHLTKCHACRAICTWSPLRAAMPLRFGKNTQDDTSEVLRLPRKMKMDTSKVLRLPRKMQRMF